MEIEEEKSSQPEDVAPPPAEAFLAEPKQLDPDQAVLAEQSILSYTTGVIDRFRENIETALSSFSDWLSAQNDVQATFNSPGFIEQAGKTFLEYVTSLAGGTGTPIGLALFTELDGQVDMAARGFEASVAASDLIEAVRGVSWYLRDNLQFVLSNKWDQLRDLAYEGSSNFIPALYAFGLPQERSPSELAQALEVTAEQYRLATATQQEHLLQEAPQPEIAQQIQQSQELSSLELHETKLTF